MNTNPKSSHVLVTGAAGFVGSTLVAHLLRKQIYNVRIAVHQPCKHLPKNIDKIYVGDLANPTNERLFMDIIKDTDVIIHTAARAHILKNRSTNPVTKFFHVNFHGTINLATRAAHHGVKRFIFISTIGVNGARTPSNIFFNENAPPSPQTPYAQSKWEAEKALWKLAEQTNMEVVIIRPPLVYGYNAPGNFGRLLKAVSLGWPIPFGAINNRRSMLYVENLIDFLIIAIKHPLAANQLFVLADDGFISTAKLIKTLAKGMKKPARLIPFPQPVIETGLRVLGKGNLITSLCKSLLIDTRKAKRLLGWKPPISMQNGLIKAAQCFAENNRC